MAYLSGSAIYIRFTRSVPTEWCGGISMYNDTFQQNFGTKSSSGTVTIICNVVT